MNQKQAEQALEELRAAYPEWIWSERANAPGILQGCYGAHLSVLVLRVCGAPGGWLVSAMYRETPTSPIRERLAQRVKVVKAMQKALDALGVKG